MAAMSSPPLCIRWAGAACDVMTGGALVDAVQLFLPVRPTNANDEMQGLQRTAGNIPTEYRHNVGQTFKGDGMKKSSLPVIDDDGETAKHAGSHHEHETDPRLSRPVEKLVASVSSDADIFDIESVFIMNGRWFQLTTEERWKKIF